jgi:hypothetical protein
MKTEECVPERSIAENCVCGFGYNFRWICGSEFVYGSVPESRKGGTHTDRDSDSIPGSRKGEMDPDPETDLDLDSGFGFHTRIQKR